MKFENVAWSEEARHGLGETLADDEPIIKSMIESGKSQLYKVNDGESWFCFTGDENELVLQCMKGKNGVAICDVIFTWAKQQGFKTIRFHTNRKGMPRLFKKFNPIEVETVYRITV